MSKNIIIGEAVNKEGTLVVFYNPKGPFPVIREDTKFLNRKSEGGYRKGKLVFIPADCETVTLDRADVEKARELANNISASISYTGQDYQLVCDNSLADIKCDIEKIYDLFRDGRGRDEN